MAGCSVEDGHDHLYKLLLIGDSCVGKSSLLSRFTRGEFRPDHNPTTTNNVVARDVYVDGKIIKAQFVDIAGNHKYRDFSTDVQRENVVGALIVYDVTRHSTFKDVERWYRELRIANGEIEVTLIGNKSDIVEDLVTISVAGKAFAERVSISFTETSAKDSRNVEKAFAELITRIFREDIKYDNMDVMDAHAARFSSEARISKLSGKHEPTHYMLKIESFSLISEAQTEKFESGIFEASGYNWRLELYPYGNKEENASSHISIYLTICDTESLPKGWEVCVDCKFCVYDHIQDSYITFQDVEGKRISFHERNIKWGFSKLISLDSFSDARNGFLFHDSCVFGAEVFEVSKYADKDQYLSLIKPPKLASTYTWTIHNFSTITEDVMYSDYFKVGKVKWKLVMYPKGKSNVKGMYLSIFLRIDASGLPSDEWSIFSKYRCRVKNQCGYADEERETNRWFDDSSKTWGWPSFMLLSEVVNPEKGFLMNDVLTVEAEFLVVGMLKDYN